MRRLLAIALLLLPGSAAANEAVQAQVRDDGSMHLVLLWGGFHARRAGDDALLLGSGELAWEGRWRSGARLGVLAGAGGGPTGAAFDYEIVGAIPLFAKQDSRRYTVTHRVGFGSSQGFGTTLPRTRSVALLIAHRAVVARVREDLPVLYLPDARIGLELRREIWARVRYVYRQETWERWAGRLLRLGVTVRGGAMLEWVGAGIEGAVQFVSRGGGLQFLLDLESGSYLPSPRTEAMRTRPPQDADSYMLPDEGLTLASPARIGILVRMGVQLGALPPPAPRSR